MSLSSKIFTLKAVTGHISSPRRVLKKTRPRLSTGQRRGVQTLTALRPRQLPKRTTRSRGDIHAGAHTVAEERGDEEEPVIRETVVLPITAKEIEHAEYLAKLSPVSWSRLLKRSYTALVDGIFSTEKLERVSAAENHVDWRRVLCPLFMTVPRPILEAALDGSLARRVAERDTAVYRNFTYMNDVDEHDQSPWLLQTTNPHGLAIYLRQLVNDHGLSPTGVEFMQVVDVLRQYASGATHSDMATKIDNRFEEGRHWFFEGKEVRVRLLHQWCMAITLLCDDMVDKTRPLPKPRSYCGYTRSMASRTADYMAHRSTTWLVGLVESAFAVLMPKKAYKLHTFCVAYIAMESEVKYAERAFTRCTESQIKYGGFCVAPPGQCSSAYFSHVPKSNRDLYWAQLKAWRAEHMEKDWQTNLESEHKFATAPHRIANTTRTVEDDMAKLDACNERMQGMLARFGLS
jgi:hypothetical protein